MTGRAVRVVETPQLGRVEFADGPSIAETQRYIAALEAQCIAAGGDPGVVSIQMRRRPISMEAEP